MAVFQVFFALIFAIFLTRKYAEKSLRANQGEYNRPENDIIKQSNLRKIKRLFYKGFKVFPHILMDIQGFQGPLVCFQGFQGFQGPAYTMTNVKSNTSPFYHIY